MSRRVRPLPDNWATEIRPRILQRDNHRCQHPTPTGRCLAPATHVDHIIGAADGGNDTDANLQALCVWHHNRKTAAEAGRHATRHKTKRPTQPHPGLTKGRG